MSSASIKCSVVIVGLLSLSLQQASGYFFRKWESTPLSDNLVAPSTANINEFRNYNLAQQSVSVQSSQEMNPSAAASFQFPIAIQLPHHIIPLAMFPALPQISPAQKLQIISTSTPNPTTNINSSPTTLLKLQEAPSSVPTIQAVQFVPCVCNNINRDSQRWSKASPTSGYLNPTFQAVHLLPCYCPIIREVVESSYVPQIATTTSDSVTSNYPPIISTKV